MSWLDEDQIAALRGLERLIAEVIQDMAASGEAVPQPLADRTYSGRLNLRVSPELHRKLALEAANRGVPLNRYGAELLTS